MKFNIIILLLSLVNRNTQHTLDTIIEEVGFICLNDNHIEKVPPILSYHVHHPFVPAEQKEQGRLESGQQHIQHHQTRPGEHTVLTRSRLGLKNSPGLWNTDRPTTVYYYYFSCIMLRPFDRPFGKSPDSPDGQSDPGTHTKLKGLLVMRNSFFPWLTRRCSTAYVSSPLRMYFSTHRSKKIANPKCVIVKL